MLRPQLMKAQVPDDEFHIYFIVLFQSINKDQTVKTTHTFW